MKQQNNKIDDGSTITTKTAAETARQQTLVPQQHGGALLSGGMPGNKGGSGRPKESLRERMRTLLDSTLEAMGRALAGERLAHDAARRLMSDARIAELPAEVRCVIEAACADHLPSGLSPREIALFHETLARYGVGTQQEVEKNEKQVRYVIRLPQRPSPASDTSGSPVRVVNPQGKQ